MQPLAKGGNLYYALDENNQVVEASFEEWVLCTTRRVAYTDFSIGYVSTIFLGISFGINPPVPFETMVFLNNEEGGFSVINSSRRRYSTWEEALAGHQAILDAILSLLNIYGEKDARKYLTDAL